MIKRLLQTLTLALGITAAAHASAVPVQVSDTITNLDGTKPRCTLYISNPSFLDSTGTLVAPNTIQTNVTSGVVNVSLIPTTNSQSNPPPYYAVSYSCLNGPPQASTREFWAVPPTGPVTLGQIRVAPFVGNPGLRASNYAQVFTGVTSVVLNHKANTTAIQVQCYNSVVPPQWIGPNSIVVNDANNATVTFTNAQSGYCVVNSGNFGLSVSAGPPGPTGPSGPPGAPGGGQNAGGFTFTQSPSGTLSAGVGATATLTPVPLGVNGTDSSHYLYIPSCSGGAQAVLITGGTAVSGATTGTVTFTPTNSCTAGWTISSATAGIQEALQFSGTNSSVVVPPGVNVIFANIIFPFGSVNLYGLDRANTTIKAANATNLNQMTGSGSNSQISISGITFDGNFINQSSGSGNGVTFAGGVGYHVFGCAFKDFGIAFPAQSVSVALFVANGSDINFHDNEFRSDWGYDIQISGNSANPYQYRGVKIQRNQFGAPSVTQSNTNVNFWDSQAAGNISTYVFHMADVVFSGNEVNGAPPNPVAGIPVYIGNCYNVVVNGNFVNGMGNGVGTISVTNGSGAVTGLNTGWDFTSTIRSVAGGFMLIEGDATLYKISSASSATALVVSPAIVRTSASGLRYKLSQANDMLGIVGDEGVTITGNLTRYSRDNGISVGGNGTFVVPAHYAISGNTSEFNKTAGLLISGTFFSSSITGNTFTNNGTGFGTPGAGAAGFFSGIFIASDVSNLVQNNIISGNLLGDDQVTPTQQYGITAQDGHATLNVLGPNYFRGNVQGDIEPTFKLTTFASDGLTGILGPLSYPFASLPAVPAAGFYVYCNNCTTAATCAGGGSGHMAVSNGTNWTCQ